MAGSGGTVSFKYDPLGRRIYKSSPLGTASMRTTAMAQAMAIMALFALNKVQ